MIVLLKVAATCATPTTTFFFSFLRVRAPFFSAGAAILLRHFLLAGDRLGGPFARARVGMRALATNRKALAVTKAEFDPLLVGNIDAGDASHDLVLWL